MKLRSLGLRRSTLVLGAAIPLGTAAVTLAAEAPSPPQFVEPANGATVTSPLTLRFRLAEEAAGAGAMKGGTMKGMPGMSAAPHVHLIVDAPLPEPGAMVPADGRHRHLMHGERRTVLQLKPGDHTLQLVLAAANHRVGTPPIASEKITVHVIAKKAAAP